MVSRVIAMIEGIGQGFKKLIFRGRGGGAGLGPYAPLKPLLVASIEAVHVFMEFSWIVNNTFTPTIPSKLLFELTKNT